MTVVISLWLFLELNMIQLILQFAWLSRRKRISINSKSSSRPKNVKVVVGKTVLSDLIGKLICFDIVKFLSKVCRQNGQLALTFLGLELDFESMEIRVRLYNQAN
jgi:hypothetical protein